MFKKNSGPNSIRSRQLRHNVYKKECLSISMASIIGNSVAALSAIGVVLTLAGFGAALAFNSLFPFLNPFAIFRSPFDFLILSSDVVLAIFIWLIDFDEKLNLNKMIFSPLTSSIGIIVLLIYWPSKHPAKIRVIAQEGTTYADKTLKKIKDFYKKSHLDLMGSSLIGWVGSSTIIVLAPKLIVMALTVLLTVPITSLSDILCICRPPRGDTKYLTGSQYRFLGAT